MLPWEPDVSNLDRRRCYFMADVATGAGELHMSRNKPLSTWPVCGCSATSDQVRGRIDRSTYL